MDMKKMLVEYRQFQHKRGSSKQKLTKKASFKEVTVQIGDNNPSEASVIIIQGSAILISATNGDQYSRYHVFENEVETYDDDNEHPGSVVILLKPPQDNWIIHLNSAEQKTNFILALRAFLQLSNDEVDASSD